MENCKTCNKHLDLVKLDYSKGGCEHTDQEGFICLAFASEGTACWMVGQDENTGFCECYTRKQPEPELMHVISGTYQGQHHVSREDCAKVWSEFAEKAKLDMYGFYEGKKAGLLNGRGSITNDIFEINPYYWNDDDEEAEKPNFWYKPTDLKIYWYKYPLRDTWANQEITAESLKKVLEHCLQSLEACDE